MNQLLQTQFFGGLQARIRGIFNLNDPRWGRGEDGSSNEKKPEPGSSGLSQSPSGQKGRNEGSGGQPPDLDELWRDLNRKLAGLFGGKNNGGRVPPGGDGNFQPDMKNAGVGVGVIAAIAVLIWLGTGFFIVQEGQQAVNPGLQMSGIRSRHGDHHCRSVRESAERESTGRGVVR